MRIIDADALEDKVADLYTEGEEATETDKVVNDVIDLIDNAPTVERPTGHWIKVTDCYCWHWECENCHKRPSRTNTGYDDLSNFCPNCGADMRKEAEDE